jgi:hypothetical protein
MTLNGKIGIVAALILTVLLFSSRAASSAQLLPTPVSPRIVRTASPAELNQARAEWENSAHSDTFDDGMGANTTCAKCKSPSNYDPSQNVAAQFALDCASCKRVPGQPRPELTGGEPVSQANWRDISCEICHKPAGSSYDVNVSFWDQSSGTYLEIESTTQLCAHCHEGQHGFEVVEEQNQSQVHKGLLCTDCHGSHGERSACTDCHDPSAGAGAPEHARHTDVNCTACHDAGGLSIWYDNVPNSIHLNQYITRRFAHTLTSWPSHNLSKSVNCLRCHHPQTNSTVPRPALADQVSCEACHHHQDGAVLMWCQFLSRNPDPIQVYSTPTAPP